jgi:hypothetical protein
MWLQPVIHWLEEMMRDLHGRSHYRPGEDRTPPSDGRKRKPQAAGLHFDGRIVAGGWSSRVQTSRVQTSRLQLMSGEQIISGTNQWSVGGRLSLVFWQLVKSLWLAVPFSCPASSLSWELRDRLETREMRRKRRFLSWQNGAASCDSRTSYIASLDWVGNLKSVSNVFT